MVILESESWFRMARQTKAKARKPKRLQFKYCECGCKGSACNPAADLHFWIYNDLRGSFFLRRGHGHLGTLLGTYTDHLDAVDAATALAKQELEKFQAAFV